MAVPIRMRLDNASNIYPACHSKTYASLFRMSITLNETVDRDILQTALEATVRRIPSFGYTLSNGAFWWYLRKIDAVPQVSDTTDLCSLDFKKNGGFMFKVCADGCRIVLDVFHVLGDGGAGVSFIQTLTAEYLRLKHGIAINYGGRILDPSEEPDRQELEDAFRRFSGLKGALEKNEPAYHIRGTRESSDVLRNIRMVLPTDRVKEVASKYGCTVTDLLSAAMVAGLQKVHANDLNPKRRNTLKVNVPVDLRRIFGGNTLRNYSSYIFVGVDVTNGYLGFDDIVKTVKLQKGLLTMKKSLEPKIAANVALEESLWVRCIPRFLKGPVIDTVNLMKGDRYCTHTFSNIGNVELPEAMKPYVAEMDFVLGRQRRNAGATAGIGYDKRIFLNFSRNISESLLEDAFVSVLDSLGIEVSCREV